MTEKICRLCLRAILDDNFHTIEETLKDLFYKLFLKLNIDMSLETEVCNDCEENLQAFFNFKSTCDRMKERTDFSFEDLENTKSVDDLIRCYFCRNITTEENFTSLNDSKENIALFEMLKEYVPDLNLSDTEDLLTCENCLDSLREFSNFLITSLGVEERIQRYAEIQGTNEKDQINLKDVKQFTFEPTLTLERESHENNQEKFDKDDVEPGELNIKTDEIDIKYEQINESLKKSPTEIKLDDDPVEMPEYKGCINSNYKNSSSLTVYQCEPIKYQTPRENAVNDILANKSTSAISLFKCELCTFETKTRHNLNKHLLSRHKNVSETTYKCDSCPYETKHKQYLHGHKFIHKSPPERPTFKCKLCTFETKFEHNLDKHVLYRHKNLSEETSYKCDSCTYEAKQKRYLKAHSLIHKNVSEVLMFKCDQCSYESRHKRYLNSHKLIHKSPLEIPVFLCDMCTFETRHKNSLRLHLLTHKSPSEVTLFKCEKCTYESKRKSDLKKHVLCIHTTLE